MFGLLERVGVTSPGGRHITPSILARWETILASPDHEPEDDSAPLPTIKYYTYELSYSRVTNMVGEFQSILVESSQTLLRLSHSKRDKTCQ